MPKYTVYLQTYASTSVDVEAADKSEAAEKAYEELDAPGLCAQCSGWGRDSYLELGEEWEIGDYDMDIVEKKDD